MKKIIIVLAFALLVPTAYVKAESLKSFQIDSIVSLLRAFGVDAATINRVETTLRGRTPTVSNQYYQNSYQQPSVTITSPDYGTFTAGSYMSVSWKTANVPSNFVFDIIRLSGGPNNREYTLATNVDNGWISKNMLIPSDLPAGAYRLQIKSYLNGTLLYDESNDYITITSPTIAVAYPNGGETLVPGQTYTFRWSNTNAPSYVSLNLVNVNNNNGAVIPIIANIPNTGSYTWTVPSNMSNMTAYLYVFAGEYGIKDASDNYFTITSPTTQTSTSVPMITNFSQSSAQAGATITIYGQGFDSTGNIVIFNGLGVSVSADGNVSSNRTAFTFVIPSFLHKGAYDVTVKTSQGTSNKLSFTVNSESIATQTPPSITSISPYSGPAGTLVTLGGTGFNVTRDNIINVTDGTSGYTIKIPSMDGVTLKFSLVSTLTVGKTYKISVDNDLLSNIAYFTVTY